jgi:predicted RNA-binding protein YlxR (DUF448 family)
VVASPTRRCIVSGEVAETTALVRFVVDPDGTVVPDVGGDLPGRGMWLSSKREVLDTARTKGLFARAARTRVSVDEGLADLTERLLARRSLDTLGLARRAGHAVVGFEKVRALLGAGEAAVLIAARDAARDGKAKLRRLGTGVPEVGLFTVAELSLALGRENVVHAALSPSRLANRFLIETARLAGFRPSDETEVGEAAEFG